MARVLYALFVLFAISRLVNGYCDQRVRLYKFDMESIFGMWFAVGYAQHTPDFTDKPANVGCIVLHIDDVTEERRQQWYDEPAPRRNWSTQYWKWSNARTPWHHKQIEYLPDFPLKQDKNEANDQLLRLVWVEDGHRVEQNYVYLLNAPTLWTSELWQEDEWNMGTTTRRFEVIRVLKASSTKLVLHHCIDGGDGRVFSLTFRRKPAKMSLWEWKEVKQTFHNYELRNVFRETALCSANAFAMWTLSTYFLVIFFLQYL